MSNWLAPHIAPIFVTVAGESSPYVKAEDGGTHHRSLRCTLRRSSYDHRAVAPSSALSSPCNGLTFL
ncbi:hypothetical protein BDQ17DRAFT_1437531 [Cyathus striatus]|nr:hypothetical protein BDQ17DRAFT_1437531 [Cyathus striatus]